MEQGFYYLAGPHKGTPEEERYRYEKSLKITAQLFGAHINVFSPIVYGRHVTEAIQDCSLEERRLGMMALLLEFVRASKGLILVTMVGWEKSWGARQELLFCQENQIPVYVLRPEEICENYAKVLSRPVDSQELTHLLNAA